MPAKISDAIVRIEAETSSFNRQMKQAGLQVDRFAKGATTSLNILKTTIGALGVGFGATFLVQGSKELLNYADNIGKVADSIGVSTQNLQEFRVAAQLSNINIDQFDQGLRNFAYVLGQARNGTGALVTILNKMDPAFLQTITNAKSTGDAFRLLIDHTAKLGNQMDKAAVFSAAFTQTVGVRMLNLIKGGAGAFDQMTQKARDLGLVISDDLLRSAAQTNDKLSLLSDVIKTKFAVAVTELTPLIDKAANAALHMADEFSRALTSVNQFSARQIEQQLGGVQDTINANITKLNEFEKKRRDLVTAAQGHSGLGRIFSLADEAQIKIIDSNIKTIRGYIEQLRQQKNELEARLGQLNLESAQGITKGGSSGGSGSGAALLAGAKADAQVKAFRQLQQQADALTQSMKTPTQAAFDAIDKYTELLDHGLISTQTWGVAVNKALDDAATANEKMTGDLYQTTQAAQDLGFTFQSAFEDAVVNGNKLRDVMKGLLQDIERIVLRQTVTKPLGNWLANAVSGALPGFASGTDYAPGGLALVGERGPELVNLPRGSQVIPNGQLSGGGSLVINVDARGSVDPTTTAATVKRAVSQAVATMRDMKTRGKLPEFA